MITAIDTNVLLDILIPNPQFLQKSLTALETAFAEGTLILSETVYAELASQFDHHDTVQAFLIDSHIQLHHATPDALYLASEAWKTYHTHRPQHLTCPTCGHQNPFPHCSNCNHVFSMRQHIISDFLIGAHAQTLANRLLTRDRGFYRTYFTNLTLFFPQ
ncbi:MAG: type II toxin-antitoxin system VapC family toxin [Candidatus Latescibacteria bacterium]|jgi:predicted nucleic acid-binding protein|nr:type II toxin-antitoxin system VapC family toxin [Candidatus Latescibacterota bacterium]MBT4138783.1 type II toxin-antitoxin system VapC family toxin [Candidatus Latescibacterota bacterium]MBT5831260.1 type II toxin-antitoxin system VapC family toxin [Candidatus Latescibacterota bacterium]